MMKEMMLKISARKTFERGKKGTETLKPVDETPEFHTSYLSFHAPSGQAVV